MPVGNTVAEHLSLSLSQDIVYGTDSALEGKYQCDLFYEILEREERYPFLRENQRQIKNLQRGVLECFATITLEFVEESREEEEEEEEKF